MVYTNTGLPELEVQFVGIGKFTECTKIVLRRMSDSLNVLAVGCMIVQLSTGIKVVVVSLLFFSRAASTSERSHLSGHYGVCV